MIGEPRSDGGGARYFGLYPAVVRDLRDPQRLGRVEVALPWLGSEGEAVRAWATLLSPYADQDQGIEMLPEVDSEVVVGFEAGDPRRPYIVGACWNGRESLPEAPTAANDRRLIKSRSGSLLEFNDAAGGAQVTVSMASGHRLVLDDAAQTVTVAHANGSNIEINAAGQVRVTANATVEVTAAALNVHAPVAVFDGLVQCTSLIASASISSPLYSPGAGNIW